MNENTIMERMQEIFRDIFDDETMQINKLSSAETIPAWDSLMHINLVVTIENEFKIKFALGELQGLKNVGEMVGVIVTKTV